MNNLVVHTDFLTTLHQGALFWRCPLCHTVNYLDQVTYDHDELDPMRRHGYGRCVRSNWAD